MTLKTLLAFFVLAVSFVLADAIAAPPAATQPVDEARSQDKTNPLAEKLAAAGGDACSKIGGKCIDLKKTPCTTTLVANKCPGPNVGCCLVKVTPKK